MNYLVTGASGFVGIHLVNMLTKSGHSVVGIGSTKHQASGAIYKQVDLLDELAVKKLDLKSFDGIFHLAGLAKVGDSFQYPFRYVQANAGMQINLLEACIVQQTFPKVLIVSSGSVYSSVSLPVAEDSPIEPKSPYAVSKLTQEQLGVYYRHRGFKVVVARPFNHIGPGQDVGMITADLAKQIATAERQNSITSITTGDLSAKRDFTDVRDIVRAYLALMEKGQDGEIYNVCSGMSYSGQEILSHLLAASSVKLTKKTDPELVRPVEVANIYGDFQKLHQDTGWKPAIPVEQTLSDVLADWRQRLAA